jgi:GAF domain-containing protein
MGSLFISEDERLQALQSVGVLEMPSFPIGDRYVDIAAKMMNAPIGAITIIDKEHQWFKASKGLSEIKQTSRAASFCAHAIKEPFSVFEIPDARRDPRFVDNPLVIGSPGIVFYAGVPLLTASGFPMGALCIMDVIPRKMSEDQMSKLRNLGKMVEKNLRLHGAIYHMNYRSKALEFMAESVGRRWTKPKL